jgi:hypothetical protein
MIFSNVCRVEALTPDRYEQPRFTNIEELIEWVETVDATNFQSGRFENGLLSIRGSGEIFIPSFNDSSIELVSLVAIPTATGMTMHYRFPTPSGQIHVNVVALTPQRAVIYQQEGILSLFTREDRVSQLSETIVNTRNPYTDDLLAQRMESVFIDESDFSVPNVIMHLIKDGFQISLQTNNPLAVAYFNSLVLETVVINERNEKNDRNSTSIIQSLRTIRFTIGSTDYFIDDVIYTNDVAPFIDTVHNRTMIPLRVVSEALGAEVDWSSQSNTAFIHTGIRMYRIFIDEPLPHDMGVPILRDNRVFVPLRYAADILGATTHWDSENAGVYIYQ